MKKSYKEKDLNISFILNFFNSAFNFGVIGDAHSFIRNCVERFCAQFTQFSLMRMSCKTVVK